jgi:hypothetical protein
LFRAVARTGKPFAVQSLLHGANGVVRRRATLQAAGQEHDHEDEHDEAGR